MNPPATTPPPGTRSDWWERHRDRFTRPCAGTKADPDYRCGFDHDCTGHNTRGGPCGRAPIHGGTVCPIHGGAAPQTREAARRRVDAEADPTFATLVHLRDYGTSDQIRLRAAVALAEYTLGRKAAEPADIIDIARADPSQIGRLLRALRDDPTLRHAVEAAEKEPPP